MNYLSHARDFLDRPWGLVGTALPDWLRVVDRRARIPPWRLDGDPGGRRGEILRGLRAHYEDDAWFHATPAFREVTGAIARRIRAVHPDRPDRRMRASFYAHLMTEMLLDRHLERTRPGSADRFHEALASLDPAAIADETRALVVLDRDRFERLVTRFRGYRLFDDYADDARLVARLDDVGRRVRQPPLPSGFARTVAFARPLVAARAGELLRGARSPGPPARSARPSPE